jgi:Flp pilus assembly pilin Flp
MLKRISAICNDEEGMATIEYALLLGTLAVAVMTTWTSYGNTLRNREISSSGGLQPH